MSTFSNPSSSGNKVEPPMPPGSVWGIIVGVLIIAMVAFSLAGNNTGPVDPQAPSDQVNPVPVISGKQNLEMAPSIKSHPPEDAPDETALKNVFQPKCDYVCEYYREHILWGEQLVEDELIIKNAFQPKCDHLPYCDYFRQHIYWDAQPAVEAP